MFRQLNCLNYRYPSIPSCLPGTAEYTTDESKAIQNRCDHQILLGARFYWIDGIDCDFNECGLCDALVRRLYYFHLYHWLPWVSHCLWVDLFKTSAVVVSKGTLMCVLLYKLHLSTFCIIILNFLVGVLTHQAHPFLRIVFPHWTIPIILCVVVTMLVFTIRTRIKLAISLAKEASRWVFCKNRMDLTLNLNFRLQKAYADTGAWKRDPLSRVPHRSNQFLLFPF